jgi:hypothetical protein
MKYTLTEYIQKISIYTTDPDTDWKRIFSVLLIVLLGVSIWSFSFFSQIRNGIIDFENQAPKNPGELLMYSETKLIHLFESIQKKKSLIRVLWTVHIYLLLSKFETLLYSLKFCC